uniref:CCHC-type domain-containing protein n=1 Tax=Arundo donax TaxID=35708 RepID=A0A0A9CE45_ARUDO
MHPFNIRTSYKAIEGPKWAPYPQAQRMEPGRPRSTRLQGDMDAADAVDGLRKCRLCQQPGHDRRTCPTRQ